VFPDGEARGRSRSVGSARGGGRLPRQPVHLRAGVTRSVVDPAGKIRTVAGTASRATGDGGPAHLARLNGPSTSRWTRATGSDFRHREHVIRRYSPDDRTIRRVAGTGQGRGRPGRPATAWSSSGRTAPSPIRCTGAIYVSDSENHRVVRLERPRARARGGRERRLRPRRTRALPPLPARMAEDGRPAVGLIPRNLKDSHYWNGRTRGRQLPVHGAERLLHRPRGLRRKLGDARVGGAAHPARRLAAPPPTTSRSTPKRSSIRPATRPGSSSTPPST
jgi:hypothetical protein